MEGLSNPLNYTGIFTALITPFKGESIDKEALISLIKWQLTQNINGLVIGGSTGEGVALTVEEKLQLVDTANNVIKGVIPLVLGVASSTTKETINTIKKFNNLVSAFLVSPTYYNKPTPAGIYTYFKAIYEETGAPIIVYNIPSRCGVDISKENLISILELPNVRAIKESSTDLTKMLYVKQFNKKVTWLSGDDLTALAFYALGGEGCISVAANIIPSTCIKIYQAFKAGEIQIAQQLNNNIYFLLDSLFLEVNPIPVKYALNLLKPFISAQLRAPLLEPLEFTKNSIKEALSSLSLLELT